MYIYKYTYIHIMFKWDGFTIQVWDDLEILSTPFPGLVDHELVIVSRFRHEHRSWRFRGALSVEALYHFPITGTELSSWVYVRKMSLVSSSFYGFVYGTPNVNGYYTIIMFPYE